MRLHSIPLLGAVTLGALSVAIVAADGREPLPLEAAALPARGAGARIRTEPLDLPPAWIAAPDRPASPELHRETSFAPLGSGPRVPRGANRAALEITGPPGTETTEGRNRRAEVLGLAAKEDGLGRIAALLAQPENPLTAAACTACWMGTRDGVQDAALRRRLAGRLEQLARAAVELTTRRAATLALGRLDARALRRLPDGDPEVAAAIANALPPLCAKPSEAVLGHAESLARYGAGDAARVTAVRALACAGEAAGERMEELARGADHDPAAGQARRELDLARAAAQRASIEPLEGRPHGPHHRKAHSEEEGRQDQGGEAHARQAGEA
jgi:hypothetical protein